MSLPSGTRLGPYEVLSLLGTGGMGEVYRARDTRLGRDVAIKVVLPGVAVDITRLARFEQEARAAAALNHPNITALYDIGTYSSTGSKEASHSTPYLVTELLEGSTLRDRLSSGAVPMRMAIDWARQIALGLAAAHEKGIVHRDLKPENIFITTDDRVKILDFGLAKLIEADPAKAGATTLPTTPHGTMAGMVLGTAGYMSPEQVRGVAADYRADLFAFGAVLYEMLAGRRAFGGETVMDVMMAAAREDVPPLASTRSDLPGSLVRLVERCLEKDPAKRFQSTRDLAFALEGIGGTPTGESTALSSTTMATLGPSAKLGRWLWPLATVALAGIAAGVISTFRPAPSSPAPQAFVLNLPLGFSLFRLPGVFAAMPGFWSPSPDNRWLLGIQLLPDGRSQFVLNELGTGADRPLGATAGNVSVINSAWSLDSTRLVYWDATDGFLKRLAIDTGVIDRLGQFRDVRGVAWGPDGLVLSNAGEAGSEGVGLVAISPNGGDAVQIARSVRRPSVLPSGAIVAFSVVEPRGLTLLNPKTGDRRVLLPGVEPLGSAAGHVFYNQQDKLVAHRLDEAAGALVGPPLVIGESSESNVGVNSVLLSWLTGTRVSNEPVHSGGPLTWVNRAGRRTPVPGGVRPYGGATLDLRDDLHVATATLGGVNGADVVTVRLDTGAPTRVFAQPSWDVHPRWSRDGRRLLFRSNLSLLIANVGSTSPPSVAVELIPGLERLDDWSRDGRHALVSVISTENRYDILHIDLEASGPPVPFATTPATESYARFSPEAKHVAYVSDTTGPPEVYIQTFPPAGPSQRVSLSGGTQPKWSSDGSRIYFFSPDGWIMEAAVARQRERIVVGVPTRAAQASGSDFVPSSDGQRFLIVEEPVRRSLALVNWQSLLAR